MGFRFQQVARQCLAFALAGGAAGQSAVEYAARAAGGSVSAAGHDTYMGVCRVDGALMRCMHDYYPTAFIVVVVALCAAILTLIVRTVRMAR